MPSSAALAFIRSTKASSLPERCSARATAQSLADTTQTAFTMSATERASPSFSQIWLPPMEAAWAEPVTMSSHWSWPESMASITRSSVMTLVTLAGSRGVWASFSKRTVPVSRSISTAEGASTSKAWAGRGRSSRAQSRVSSRFTEVPPFPDLPPERLG